MKTERLEMRIDPQLREDIDRWREQQAVPPSRSAAIRYLLVHGLREAPRETLSKAL
jgi:hypothetical protein